jgi:hypothetical protein
MKTPKLLLLKNQTTDHAVGDVVDEAVDAAVDPTVRAKKLHAAIDLLRQPVGQNVTMMISKTTIWTPMLN